MNRLNFGMAFALALLVGMGVRPAVAQHDNHDHGSHAAKAATPKCPVMDEPANLALSVATDDGPVYFCCEGCIPKFQRNPKKYATQLAAQRKALAHRAKVQVACPVTSEPVNKKHFVESNGEKIYLCCKGCVGKYKRDPGKYAAGLANSYSYQTKCPVMGEPINPKVSTTLSTGETIYYCCKGCDKKLRGNPAKYNKELVAQGILVNWAEAKKADSGKGHEGHGHGSGGHGNHDH